MPGKAYLKSWPRTERAQGLGSGWTPKRQLVVCRSYEVAPPDIEAFQSMNHTQNTDCVLALPACCPYLTGPRRSNRLRFGTVAKELSACAQPLAKHASAWAAPGVQCEWGR